MENINVEEELKDKLDIRKRTTTNRHDCLCR